MFHTWILYKRYCCCFDRILVWISVLSCRRNIVTIKEEYSSQSQPLIILRTQQKVNDQKLQILNHVEANSYQIHHDFTYPDNNIYYISNATLEILFHWIRHISKYWNIDFFSALCCLTACPHVVEDFLNQPSIENTWLEANIEYYNKHAGISSKI